MTPDLLVPVLGVGLWLASQWAVVRWFRIPSRLSRSLTTMTAVLGEAEEAMRAFAVAMDQAVATLNADAEDLAGPVQELRR